MSRRETRTPAWPWREEYPGRSQEERSNGCSASSVSCHLRRSRRRNGQSWRKWPWLLSERAQYCNHQHVAWKRRCSSSSASHLVCWLLQEERRLSVEVSKDQISVTVPVTTYSILEPFSFFSPRTLNRPLVPEQEAE